MASPSAAPTWGGSPASRPSDPIPHPTSATTTATIPTVTTAAITPPPDTPTSRYSVASRASSSSSSGLDYYSHNSPPSLSSQVHDHHHSFSIASHDYDQSPVLAQAQVRASLHRKPVPLPEQDQHASPVIDPVHLSSPLSIKNNPPPIPRPAAGSISPSSVEGGDSFISVPRNSNRYAKPLSHPVPLLSSHPYPGPLWSPHEPYLILPITISLAYGCSPLHLLCDNENTPIIAKLELVVC
jgi:hypothetical protein